MASDATIRIKIDANTGEARVIKRDLDQLGKSGDNAERSMQGLKRALVSFVSVAAAFQGFRAITSTLVAFESALVGVQKTTDLSSRELDKLGKTLRGFSKETEFATIELLNIAQSAGQLGVTGSDNIIKFTQTVAKLGTASDLAGEEAATSLARILNVTGEATSRIDVLASSIVALGNTFAATESQITRSATNVAQNLAIFGVSSEEATALGASLTALGVRAELSGSAVGRTFREIDASIREGGESARRLSELTGIAIGNLQQQFGESAVDVFARFAEGLDRVRQQGGSVAAELEKFGLRGEEINKVLPVLAQRSNELARALKTVRGEVANATALEEEFEKRNRTLQAEIAKLQNRFKDLGLTIGNDFAPALSAALVGLNENFEALIKSTQIFAGALTAIAFRQAIIGITAMTTAAGGLTAAMVALNATLLGPGAFVAVLGAAGAAAFVFRDELKASLLNVVTEAIILVDELINKLSQLANFGTSRLGAFFATSANRLGITDVDPQALQQAIAGANSAGQSRVSVSGFTAEELRESRDDLLRGLGNAQRPSRAPTTVTAPSVRLPNEVNQTTEATKELNREIEKTGKTVKDEVAEPINDLTVEIERDFARAFKDAFTASENGFERFIDGMKASFQNFIAEVAFQASKPIALNLIGGVAGAAGISAGSSPALAALGGGSGGAGGAAGGLGISNLSSIGSIFNSGGPVTLGGLVPGGIGQSLGFQQALGPGVFGPAAPGFLGSGATLSGALAGGAIGSLGANLLGLGNSDPIINTLSGVGGGAAAIGIGSLLGAPAGPIGIGIGSFLGTALGGLFGGDQDFPFTEQGITTRGGRAVLGRSGVLDGGDISKTRKLAEAAIGQINQFVGQIGGTLESGSGEIGTASGRSSALGSGFFAGPGSFAGGAPFTNIRNPERAVELAVQDFLSRAVISGLNDNVQQILNKSLQSGAGLQQVAQDVNLAKFIFEDADEQANPLTRALDELNSKFESLRKRASELGLPLEKINDAFESQRRSLVEGALKPLQDFLDSQALSSGSTLSPIDRLSLARSEFDETLSAIRGGDLSNLNQITGQASQLLNIGRDVFASGEGFASLESFVRQSISGLAGDLGAPGALNDSVTREMTLSNARQTSILEQVNAEIQALREENRKLRKSMERVGNAVVQNA